MRPLLRAACFFALLTGGVWPVIAPFRRAEVFPTAADRMRAEHADLQCFAEGVFRHTEPRASVRFVLPDSESDGGLVNHRLRYIVPGRNIVTAGQSDYIASWHQAGTTGRPVWSGCGGVLVRR